MSHVELTLSVLKSELKTFKKEFIEIANLIKDCKDKDDRQMLFEEKKQLQQDISEIENEILNIENTINEQKK